MATANLTVNDVTSATDVNKICNNQLQLDKTKL